MMELTACQIMREHHLTHNIEHYHGSIEAKPEFLMKYKGKEGTFIKKFLIGEEFNMNEWRVTWDAIQKDLHNFIGKPLVLTPDMNHPSYKEQDDYKVGEIIDVGMDELTRTAWQVSHVTDEKTIELIREGKIKYGSPTVLTYSKETTDRIKLGNGKIQTTLHRFIPAHDALVGEPAYGKEVDKIPAICDGTGIGCGLKLLQVSASVESADMNSDNINQITIVGFLKKSLNKHFKASTLREIVDYTRDANISDLDSCVSRKIKLITEENPEMKNDQIIAMAYSNCKDSKEGEIIDMLAEDIGEDIFNIREKIEQHKEISHKISEVNSKLKQLTG